MSERAHALDALLLDAHEAGDHRALIGLYSKAAQQAKTQEAACFYLTHAYIFALEQGDPRAVSLHQDLKSRGREE